LRVVIPLQENSLPLDHVLHFGAAVAKEARKLGGKARCFKTANSVVVEQTGISRDQIEPFIGAFSDSATRAENTLNVIVEERGAPEIDLDTEGVIPGEYRRERLTKKFLFELPDEAIVVGNSISHGEPLFVGRLRTGSDRLRVWRNAVSSGAAQAICNIYWNPKDVLDVHGIDLEAL